MVSIKARLNDIEAKLTPPVRVNYVEILNEGRRRVERRAAYRRDNEWELLEAELISELKKRLDQAREAMQWFDNNPNANLSWQICRIKGFIFSSLAKTIDDLTDCRNRSTGKIVSENRGSVIADGEDSLAKVIKKAEILLRSLVTEG